MSEIPNIIPLYRILHIDNLDYIIKIGKLTCHNHPEKDPNYIGIGDETLIKSRSNRSIKLEPFGNFSDYVSFYFTNRSPMLYVIKKGKENVIKREMSDIIYLVTKYDIIKNSGLKYVYFNGHAYQEISDCYNDDSGLETIDWDVINDRIWRNTDDDSDRQRRKQAEFLVYKEISLNYIIGIGVYNSNIKEEIDVKIKKNNLNLKCKVKHDWYY